MINFLYLLLGQLSWQKIEREEREEAEKNYLPFHYIKEIENFRKPLSFLIKNDLLRIVAYRKNHGYKFYTNNSDHVSDLSKAAAFSPKILKYFFLTIPQLIFDTSQLLWKSIESFQHQNFRFLLKHLKIRGTKIDQKTFFDEESYIFGWTILSANLKAAKYLIEQGFKKEEAFRSMGEIVSEDLVDFFKYFISIGYKIEEKEKFCRVYKCLEDSKIYKYIQEIKINKR